MDVCPSCGAFATLDEASGWCAPCAGIELTFCARCSQWKSRGEVREWAKGNGGRGVCRTCETERKRRRRSDPVFLEAERHRDRLRKRRERQGA